MSLKTVSPRPRAGVWEKKLSPKFTKHLSETAKRLGPNDQARVKKLFTELRKGTAHELELYAAQRTFQSLRERMTLSKPGDQHPAFDTDVSKLPRRFLKSVTALEKEIKAVRTPSGWVRTMGTIDWAFDALKTNIDLLHLRIYMAVQRRISGLSGR